MLDAPVLLERHTGQDQYGNDTYATATTESSFIDAGSTGFPTDTSGSRTEKTPATTTTLMMDGIGVKPRDKITYDGVAHYVTEAVTNKDGSGADLYQDITVTTTKRG
jgi:hypothetical protein